MKQENNAGRLYPIVEATAIAMQHALEDVYKECEEMELEICTYEDEIAFLKKKQIMKMKDSTTNKLIGCVVIGIPVLFIALFSYYWVN